VLVCAMGVHVRVCVGVGVGVVRVVPRILVMSFPRRVATGTG
jgi:hypothetical protein